MRSVYFIISFLAFISSINSQCFNTKVANTFNFECTTGNPIGARIGLDSVVHTATDWGQISTNNGFFIIYKNGVDVGSGVEDGSEIIYNSGDVMKIVPALIGIGNISTLTDETGCPAAWGSNRDVCSQPSLPVTWLKSPTITIKTKLVDISWQVSSQTSNSHFIIEHSTNAKSFEEIGRIAGDGTLHQEKQYTYIHETPYIGINYYRIKQVDYDGKYSYSEITSVTYDTDEQALIYPNPATSEVTIIIKDISVLQVVDMYGRLILTQNLTLGQNKIDISSLSKGIYIFTVGTHRYRVLKE
jgi:hypothetical protein